MVWDVWADAARAIECSLCNQEQFKHGIESWGPWKGTEVEMGHRVCSSLYGPMTEDQGDKSISQQMPAGIDGNMGDHIPFPYQHLDHHVIPLPH